jgi:hypothetical protein
MRSATGFVFGLRGGAVNRVERYSDGGGLYLKIDKSRPHWQPRQRHEKGSELGLLLCLRGRRHLSRRRQLGRHVLDGSVTVNGSAQFWPAAAILKANGRPKRPVSAPNIPITDAGRKQIAKR